MDRFPVSAEKAQKLLQRMEQLGILEEECIEKFIRGSGPGGQKINKSSSCVYLKHLPSGIEVKCQYGRSQALNRFVARCELCDRLEEIVLGEESRQKKEQEKIRRQKQRRRRRTQAKVLEEKRRHSETKSLRRAVKEE